MELKRILKVDRITIDNEAQHGEEKAIEIFCEYWEASRKGLEILKSIIKAPIWKVAINLIILAGDTVQKKICS